MARVRVRGSVIAPAEVNSLKSGARHAPYVTPEQARQNQSSGRRPRATRSVQRAQCAFTSILDLLDQTGHVPPFMVAAKPGITLQDLYETTRFRHSRVFAAASLLAQVGNRYGQQGLALIRT